MLRRIICVLMVVLIAINVSFSYPNPAALYCKSLGYEYEIIKTSKGERGICKAGTIKFYAWDLYRLSAKTEQHISNTPTLNKEKNIKLQGISLSSGSSFFPAAWDWRNVSNRNFLTPVKDQGYCGSCWAFAVVGALESKFKINLNNSDFNPDLSEQQLVSCDKSCYPPPWDTYCQEGCNGGYTDLALEYIKNNGILNESLYHYTASDFPCNLSNITDWQNRTHKLIDWYYVNDSGEFWTNDSYIANKTKEYLVKYGPIVVAYHIVCSDFFKYTSGIYEHTCNDEDGWHAMVLVGYNDIEKYWILKNSWGTDWGEDGYIRMSYNESLLVGEYINQTDWDLDNVSDGMDKCPFEFGFKEYQGCPDTYKPVIEINYPKNNSHLNTTTITVNFTIEDVSPVFSEIKLLKNGSLVSSKNTTEKGNIILNLSAPDDGKYILSITARDYYNNTNSSSIHITIDTTKPNLTIVHPSKQKVYLNASIFNITFYSDDENFNYTEVLVYNESAEINKILISQKGWHNINFSLEEGKYRIEIISWDLANNKENKAINITIDTTPPFTTCIAKTKIGNYSFGTWTNKSVNISFSCLDNLVGCKEIKYCIDNNNTCLPNLTYNSAFEIKEEGIYWIRFSGKDLVNNTENINNVSIKIDKTNPSVTYYLKRNGKKINVSNLKAYYFYPGDNLTINLSYTEKNFKFLKISSGNTTLFLKNKSFEYMEFVVNLNNLSFEDKANYKLSKLLIEVEDLAGNRELSEILILYNFSLSQMETNWKDMEDYTNANNLSFEVENIGKISFLESIDLTNESVVSNLENISSYIIIGFSSEGIGIGIDTERLREFNKKAMIFMNLSSLNLTELSIDKNICSKIVYNKTKIFDNNCSNLTNFAFFEEWNSTSKILKFKVAKFSNYELDIKKPRNLTLEISNGLLYNGIYYINSSTVVGNYSAEDNNLKYVHLSIEGKNITKTFGNNGGKFTFSNLSEGYYNLSMLAVDSALNNRTLKQSFVIDLTPPDITSFSLSSYEVYVGEDIEGYCSAIDNFGNVTTEIIGLDTSSEGGKIAKCIAKDLAGNVAIRKLFYTVKKKHRGGGGRIFLQTKTGKEEVNRTINITKEILPFEKIDDRILEYLGFNNKKEKILNLSKNISKYSKSRIYLKSWNNASSLIVKFEYFGKDTIENISFFIKVPKEFGNSSENIIVIANGSSLIKVIEEDPSYLIIYPMLKPNQSIEIEFLTKGSKNEEEAEEIISKSSLAVFAERLREYCEEGNYRCFGNILQKCINGTWINIEKCEYRCNATKPGCDHNFSKELPLAEQEEREMHKGKYVDLAIISFGILFVIILYLRLKKKQMGKA